MFVNFRRSMILMCVFLNLSLIPVHVIAATATETETDSLTDYESALSRYYQAVHQADFVVASFQMNQLVRLFHKLPLHQLRNPDAIAALSDTVTAASQALNEVAPDKKRIMDCAATMRIAHESAFHPPSPLMRSYLHLLLEDVKRAQSELQPSKRENILKQIHARYQLIRPSLRITEPAETTVKIDSFLTYLQSHVKQGRVDSNGWKRTLDELRKTFQELSSGEDRSVFLMSSEHRSLLAASLCFIAMIVCFLSFAGWLIYRRTNRFYLR